VGDVKTEYSRDFVPLAPELVGELLAYGQHCHQTQEGWLFANPATDKPYHQEEIQKKHIKPGCVGLVQPRPEAVTTVGWKTFRHSNHIECLRQGNDGRQTAGNTGTWSR
jgi:hypothetical protein